MNLTKDEVFAKAADGILKQGVISAGEDGCCFKYRSNGLKCTIGFLIDDEQYNSDLEGQDTNSTQVKRALMKSGVVEWDLVDDLQWLHDNVVPENWLSLLVKLAEHHKIKWKPKNDI